MKLIFEKCCLKKKEKEKKKRKEAIKNYQKK